MKILPIVLAVLAVLTAIPAWFIAPEPQTLPPELENRYFGIEVSGDDPAAVTALADQVGAISVVEWVAGAPRRIDVEQRAGDWVISSEDGYPADGERKVGRTAAAVLGAEKLREVTDDPVRHRELGVIDPSDLDIDAESGRGMRVTIADRDGSELVDIVIGEAVPERSGLRYVREYDADAVYEAEIDYAVLSTRFIDWVEPNPLEVEAGQARALFVRNYRIDYDLGRPVSDSEVQVARADAEADWASATTPEGQEVDQAAVDELVRTLANLRLAEVIPRLGLGAAELQQYGVIVQQNGVFAEEGEMHLLDALGFTYSVYFGRPVSGQAADAGAETSGSDRVIVVGVSYDPTNDEAKPEDDDDGLDAHIEARRERAERLNAKYREFFYVIRDSDFQTLRPQAAELFVEAGSAEEGEAATTPGQPGGDLQLPGQ